jgi:hypothetical protein
MPSDGDHLTLTTHEQASVNELIRRKVWGGFDRRLEIRETALDYLNPRTFTGSDTAWITAAVDQQWLEKQSAQHSWPSLTDYDRLAHVFHQLGLHGIIALHNAGYTLSQGEEDVGEAWRERTAAQLPSIGFTFYHGQDVERVIDTGELSLAYGTIPGANVSASEVASRVVAALMAANFATQPPPNVETRISITGLDWKKRSPPD